MKLRAQNPPHIRSRESNQTMMGDVVIAMLPLYAMAFYFYGARSAALLAVSVLTCTATDAVCLLLRRRVPNVRDYSAVVTGMLLPLLMPASIGFTVVITAGIFAIAVVKHPFGGVGQNVFNPAAAGAAYAVICWPGEMFLYPAPFNHLPLFIDGAVKLVPSPAHAMALGGVPSTDLMDMLLGNFPGPMGATNILVLLTCLLFLVVRKTASIRMTGAFLAGSALVAFLFPRAMMGPAQSVLYELMSGWLLIGAVFLLNDPVTSPKRASSKLLYGFVTGIVSLAFRHLGAYEDSFLFALLVMNSTVWMIDLWSEQTAHALRRKTRELNSNQNLSAQAGEELGDSEE